MAYSPTKYQLTHLLQDAWYRMGQMRRWIATGGSASTFINTDWAGVEEQIYDDDDAALIYGTVVVIRDAGGLGAAPEGEMGMITDYDSSSQTMTFDTITSTISAGDRVGIASPQFPMEEMFTAANLALQRLGEIDVADTSLTVSAGQTEYTLPSAIRKQPVAVNVQTLQDSNDNRWEPVVGWKVLPAAPGSNWTLVVPVLTQGYSLQVIYRSTHPKLISFDSDIIEAIHPELALSAILVEAYQWYNNMVGGTNQYMLQRENKALQDLEASKILYPIHRIVEQVSGLPHWGSENLYVPGTSDLRE